MRCLADTEVQIGSTEGLMVTNHWCGHNPKILGTLKYSPNGALLLYNFINPENAKLRSLFASYDFDKIFKAHLNSMLLDIQPEGALLS